MREFTDSDHELDGCTVSWMAIPPRVHYLLAFLRRLRSHTRERLARQRSDSEGSNKLPKDVKFARTSGGPPASPKYCGHIGVFA